MKIKKSKPNTKQTTGNSCE